ncbi:polysaccharide deacetylase family protein [Flavobacteriales bacterium]|nr:polysaccharide deacetylase family protein [Flavobacteriales bacterium]
MTEKNSVGHLDYGTWHPRSERTLRDRIRHSALNVLSALHNLKSSLSTPRVQFIYIHHVFRDEEQALRSLLLHLSKSHSFISHSEAVERIRTGNIDRPYLAFSSDDGFQNNLIASRVFGEFGISACFFLNPTTIGMTHPTEIKKFCASRLQARPVDFLNWGEVEELQIAGHEIGSHSWEHHNLSVLAEEALKEDLTRSRDALSSHCGPIKHFAYPYGRWHHFHRSGMNLVRSLGHQSCATAERGCHLRKMDLLENMLYRDHIIAGWPLNHVDHFLSQNVRKAMSQDTQPIPE